MIPTLHLFQYNYSLVKVLRLIWAITIVWFELLTFYSHVSRCTWPDVIIDKASPSPEANPTHVLLVADPQVLDHRSYPGRPPWLMTLSQYMVDLNMRKSWWATRKLSPDAIFFLGDMMDGGRFAMLDSEYEAYYRRFKSIFEMGNTPVSYIPGNHDVGLGISSGFSDRADERYISHFGPLNQQLEIANHTFILIDAPGLVEEDQHRVNRGLSFARWAATVPGGTIQFVERVVAAPDKLRKPTVLLTHIPLARPQGASCGALRERGTIRAGAGYGYENTLSVTASEWLLQKIRPSIIFSGDDHDYCEYTHVLAAPEHAASSEQYSVKEVTVKSFSMAMGVRKPGFQLLSLIPAATTLQGVAVGTTMADAPCLLPDQLHIYLYAYVPLIVFSLLALFIANARRVYVNASFSKAPPPPLAPRSPANGGQESTSSTGHKLSALSLPVRRFDDDAVLSSDANESDDDLLYVLPPPTPSMSGKDKHHRRMGASVKVGGRRVDVSALRWAVSCLVGSGGALEASKRKRRGLANGFLRDVLDVAWLPVVVFVAIAWWMFH